MLTKRAPLRSPLPLAAAGRPAPPAGGGASHEPLQQAQGRGEEPLKQNKVLAFHFTKCLEFRRPKQLDVPCQVLPGTSPAARALNNSYKNHVSPKLCDI